MKIVFLSEGVDFQLDKKAIYHKWLKKVCKEEKIKLGEIIYRFVSEERILELNKQYLNHDYLTDIITFDDSFINEINGDIYICIDVVRRNSKDISGHSFKEELERVIVHGLLHLAGYNDRTEEEKRDMRDKEDHYMEMIVTR